MWSLPQWIMSASTYRKINSETLTSPLPGLRTTLGILRRQNAVRRPWQPPATGPPSARRKRL